MALRGALGAPPWNRENGKGTGRPRHGPDRAACDRVARAPACAAEGTPGRAAAYFFGCFAARSDFSRSTSAMARSTFSAVR